MQRGDIDSDHGLVTARTVVFRRVASTVEWDSTRFSHLGTPVLTPFGAHAQLMEKLCGTIIRQRLSPAYLAQQRKAMDDLLKP